MCQIITGSAKKVKQVLLHHPDVLESIYGYNSDGFGAMWANRDGLKIVKIVPRTIEDVRSVIRSLPDDDRNVACHARLTTHGDTNLDNCHPYTVAPGKVAMMHNGILHTGNAADTKRSDTWHFIQEYLADAVTKAPDVVHSESFLTLVGDFIKQNRFVFMDDQGRLSHVNKDQGVEHDGIWFANTYAWDPETFIPTYKATRHYYLAGGWGGHGGGWSNKSWGSKSSGTKYDYASGHEDEYDEEDPVGGFVGWNEDEFFTAVHVGNVEATEDYLSSYPERALNALFRVHKAEVTRHIKSKGGLEAATTAREANVGKLLLDENVKALLTIVYKNADLVATVICYYLDWIERSDLIHEPAAQASESDDGPYIEEPDYAAKDGMLLDGSDLGEIRARYLGCEVYVAPDGGGYRYCILDPDGNYLCDGLGFDSETNAINHAIQTINGEAHRLESTIADAEEALH